MPRPPPWTPPDPLPGPLRTERLVIRWYEEEDAPALFRTVDAHRASLLPWLPWAREDHRRLEQSLERIRYFAASRRQAPGLATYVMALFDREGGDLLGGSGFHGVDPAPAKAEIGYWIRGDRQGEGLATEALRALITSGFRDWGFRRLVVTCDRRNRPSIRVAEKAGLRLEGREREARWLEEDGWGDHLTFGILAAEWDAARGRPRDRAAP